MRAMEYEGVREEDDAAEGEEAVEMGVAGVLYGIWRELPDADVLATERDCKIFDEIQPAACFVDN